MSVEESILSRHFAPTSKNSKETVPEVKKPTKTPQVRYVY